MLALARLGRGGHPASRVFPRTLQLPSQLAATTTSKALPVKLGSQQNALHNTSHVTIRAMSTGSPQALVAGVTSAGGAGAGGGPGSETLLNIIRNMVSALL